MNIKAHLFTAAATTMIAVGAGASPALAVRSQAAEAALKIQPTLQEYIGPMRTAAQQRTTMAELLHNATKCADAAVLVSHTSSPSPKAVLLWAKGAFLQASGDRELAGGLRLLLDGKTAAGKHQIYEALDAPGNPLGRANTVISDGDDALGISRALAQEENPA